MMLLSSVNSSDPIRRDLYPPRKAKNSQLSFGIGIYNHEDNENLHSPVFARSPGQCLSCISKFTNSRQRKSHERKSLERKSLERKSLERKSVERKSMERKSLERKTISQRKQTPNWQKHQILTWIMMQQRKEQEAAKAGINKEKNTWDKAVAKEDDVYPNIDLPHEKYRDWQHISPRLGGDKGAVPRKTMGKIGHFIENIGAVDKTMQHRMKNIVGAKPLERPWFPPTKQSEQYIARARDAREGAKAAKLFHSKSSPSFGVPPPSPLPRKFPSLPLQRTHSVAPSDYVEEFETHYYGPRPQHN